MRPVGRITFTAGGIRDGWRSVDSVVGGEGGPNVIPIFAHKSTPISIGVFNEGIIRNLCENLLFPTEIDSLITPGTSMGKLFAK